MCIRDRLGSDDVSLKNNYSGQIYVTAKDAFGVEVGKNAAMDPSLSLIHILEVALNLNPPDLDTVQAILPLLEKEQLSPEQTMQLARLNICRLYTSRCV